MMVGVPMVPSGYSAFIVTAAETLPAHKNNTSIDKRNIFFI
jgi:hypothetical protein